MLKKWWLSYKRRKALRNIRIGMAAFGIDMQSYTDEQIELDVLDAASALNAAGISVKQFNTAMGRDLVGFGHAIKAVAKALDGTGWH